MSLGDVQNLYAKTLDVQAIYQQAISQSELALRQTERMLARERVHKQSLVNPEEAPVSGDGAGLDLLTRARPEKQRRYRLAWKDGLGASVELDAQAEPSRQQRLDLNA